MVINLSMEFIVMIVIIVVLLLFVIVLSAVLLSGRKKKGAANPPLNQVYLQNNIAAREQPPKGYSGTFMPLKPQYDSQAERQDTTIDHFSDPRQAQDSYTVALGIPSANSSGQNPVRDKKPETRASEPDETSAMFTAPKPKSMPTSAPTPLAGVQIRYVRHGESVTFTVTEQCTLIGRDSTVCDIILDDDSFVSKCHAMIIEKRGGYYLANLNSKNGTFLNNEKVDGMARLQGTADIKIARAQLRVSMDSQG